MLKMHYPLRENDQFNYCCTDWDFIILMDVANELQKEAMNFWNPQKVYRYCTGWGKDSVSLTLKLFGPIF